MKLGFSRVVASSGEKYDEMAGIFPRVSLLMTKHIAIFLYRGDRQMTAIFVSGTEVFSDAKMTESPYE